MRPQKPRRGAHAALAAAVAEIGESTRGEPQLGTAEVAAFLSVSEGTLYKALDPDQAGEFSYVRARQITERYGCTALAEDMAMAAGGIFVRLTGETVGSARYMKTIAEIGESIHAVVQNIATAAEDGRIEAVEVRALRMRECISAALVVLVTHDLHLKEIQEAGE